MYMITIFDCKFKTNNEKIERTRNHYELWNIQSSLNAGKLDNNEGVTLMK